MRLKTILIPLIMLGINTPVLAIDLHENEYAKNISYQLDVMREQIDKLDRLRDKNQPGGFDQPCGWSCRINILTTGQPSMLH